MFPKLLQGQSRPRCEEEGTSLDTPCCSGKPAGCAKSPVRVIPEGITFAPHQIEQPRATARESPAVLDLRARPIFARRRYPSLLGRPAFLRGRRSVGLAYEVRCSRRQTC